jgi:hypothetical protein
MEDLTEKEMTGYEPAPWETVATPETIIQRLLLDRKLIESEVSTEFAKGLRERLVEIEKAIEK